MVYVDTYCFKNKKQNKNKIGSKHLGFVSFVAAALVEAEPKVARHGHHHSRTIFSHARMHNTLTLILLFEKTNKQTNNNI